MVAIFKGLRGKVRLEAVKRHTLTMFEEAFDRYRDGKVEASFVTLRGKKMRERGLLPGKKGVRRK